MTEGPSRRTLMLALAVPALLLAGFLGWKLMIVQTGEPILLKPQAVDPRDPFRGDYVILRYPESSLDLSAFGADGGDYAPGAMIYVELDRSGTTHHAIGVTERPPDLSDDQACLKGEVINAFGNTVGVRYGLESYFVPEGRGREVEEALRNERVLARIKATSACDAVLEKLLIDGKTWP